jgi:co-chaperonin GroES (HSP10)
MLAIRLPTGTSIHCEDDSVVLKLYKYTGKLRGSKLILPQTTLGEIFFGQVVQIGKGRFIDYEKTTDESGQPAYRILRKPVTVKAGDDVVFSRYHGERIQLGGVLHVVMRIDDIIARIELPKDDDFENYFRFDDGEENEAKAAAKL